MEALEALLTRRSVRAYEEVFTLQAERICRLLSLSK